MGNHWKPSDIAVRPPLLAGVFLTVLWSLTLTGSAATMDYPALSCGDNIGGSDGAKKNDNKSDLAFAIGDRLKIVFYSRVGSGSDATKTKGPDLSALIEHLDMTGEYVVQVDGTIFLPLIGKMKVAGQSEESLLTTFEEKSSETFHGATRVGIRLVEREPVYVTGNVPQPGAFKYSPGMVVLQAVSLTGLRGSGPEIETRIAVMRESERLRESQVKLADLFARRDVLIASRDRSAPSPSEELENLVGAPEAVERIAAARRVSDLEADKLSRELKTFDNSLTMLTQERSSLTQALSEAETSLKLRVERFASVSQLHGRGVMTDATYDMTHGELDSSRARWNDLRAALTRVEERILEVGQQKSRSIADADIARERQINDLQALIQQAMVVHSTLGPALAFHGVSGASWAEPHYRIVRRSSRSLDQCDADKFSLVQPGDIVEVIRPPPQLAPDEIRSLRTVGRGKSR